MEFELLILSLSTFKVNLIKLSIEKNMTNKINIGGIIQKYLFFIPFTLSY